MHTMDYKGFLIRLITFILLEGEVAAHWLQNLVLDVNSVFDDLDEVFDVRIPCSVVI